MHPRSSRRSRESSRADARRWACVHVVATIASPAATTLGCMAGRLYVSVSGIRADTLDDVRTLVDDLAGQDVPVSLLCRRVSSTGTGCTRTRRPSTGCANAGPVSTRRPPRLRPGAHQTPSGGVRGDRRARGDTATGRGGPRARDLRPAHPAVRRAPLDVVPGALVALPRAGFRVNLGFTGWDDLVTGSTTRARVLGFGDGFRVDPWWCRMVVAATNRTARRGGHVRLSIAGKHLATPLARRPARLRRPHPSSRADAATYRELTPSRAGHTAA